MLTADQIREKYLNYWQSSPREAKVVPNVSLIPNVDSTLLFVNSGMFPLVNYLSGQPHPLGKRLVNAQRCIRTEDIEEVGDNRHHTMFEMMGNWSLGDFFKQQQLPWVMNFFVTELGLDISNIYVTVFKGNEVAAKDEESIILWKEIYKSYGLDAIYTEDPLLVGQEDFRIFGLGKKDNWWQRGEAAGELGGPDSEMYFNLGAPTNPNHVGPVAINDDSGQYVEFGNSVFMQYQMSESLEWQEMAQKNVDFGGGLERLVSIVQGQNDNYDTDLFQPMIKKLEQLSGKKWKDDSLKGTVEFDSQNFSFRAIADHIRASSFLIADGVEPGGKEQSYILRRLIRRMIRKALLLGIEQNFTVDLAHEVVEAYQYSYPHVKEQSERIFKFLEQEENQFRQTLTRGTRELQKLLDHGQLLTGKMAFDLYQTYGFPLEMILEEMGILTSAASDIIAEFKSEQAAHSDLSRVGADAKFKGGLADSSEIVTKLHTTHHLLLAALRKVLGEHVHQKGSNITAERLRIDFSHSEKMTVEQISEVEQIVNDWILQGLEVFRSVLRKETAQKIKNIEMEFGANYPDIVSVYSIGLKSNPSPEDKLTRVNTILEEFLPAISIEFCGGPHIQNTSELRVGGQKFKIIKEESSSSGVRRIKASLVQLFSTEH